MGSGVTHPAGDGVTQILQGGQLWGQSSVRRAGRLPSKAATDVTGYYNQANVKITRSPSWN